MASGRDRKIAAEEIIDKVKQRLQGWKMNTLAVFGSCKSIFEKYSIFRKGKYFHVFGYISKNFLKNIFWCLEKKKEKTNPEEGWRDRTAIVEIAIDGTIAPLTDRPRRRSRSRRSTSGDDRTAH